MFTQHDMIVGLVTCGMTFFAIIGLFIWAAWMAYKR